MFKKFLTSHFATKNFLSLPRKSRGLGKLATFCSVRTSENVKEVQPSITPKKNKYVDEDVSRMLFIRGFPIGWDELQLNQFFGNDKGSIQSMNLVRTRLGKSMGRAIVKCHHLEQATEMKHKYEKTIAENETTGLELFYLPDKLSVNSLDKPKWIKIQNIPHYLNKEDLRRFAEDYGTIASLDIVYESPKNKPIAILKFDEPHATLSFLECAEGKSFFGRKLQ